MLWTIYDYSGEFNKAVANGMVERRGVLEAYAEAGAIYLAELMVGKAKNQRRVVPSSLEPIIAAKLDPADDVYAD